MENTIKLPEEYSNSGELNISNYDLDGNDLNLKTLDSTLNLDDSDVYKMVGEESNKTNAVAANVSNFQVKASESPQVVSKEEDEQTQAIPSSENIKNDVINFENQKNNNSSQNNEVIELDKKISNLKQILDNLISENKIENINNVVNESQTNITNDLVNNSDVISDIKNIVNEINNLENKKSEYFSSKSDENVSNQNIVSNLINEKDLLKDSGNVVLDNFTPNLKINSDDTDEEPKQSKTENKQLATKRAIETERAMGGDPIVEVVPGVGDVVIDNSTQNSVKEAVEQHGGWGKAISDSSNNQSNYFENLENSENNPNYKTESNSFLQNETFNNTKNENLTENFPEPNKDLVKNSADSILILNKISQQLESISKSINKSFGVLGNSIKDIKSEQKNYFYNSTNNNTSSNNAPVNNNRQGDTANNIPEIRGDAPLKDDFPSNFKLDSLFSNLRS